MIAEIGHFALVLALTIAISQSLVPMIGANRGEPAFMAFASAAAIAQFTFVAVAFGCLTFLFVTSDFSVAAVAANSHSAKPLVYKISGVWGNHEGSMLLWVLILALFGVMAASFGQHLPDTLKARALAVQGMIGVGFFAFILFTSNPFARLDPAPRDGNGLNPLLQDLGLAFHPPFLYLGYVGFSMAFSFAVAALIEGRVEASWARWVRPWVLAAWCFLTIGITLGSFWAYYELGWGGWWFWDPVENASFMPWLVGTALLHSALVVERRHALVNWTILLCIMAFSLSLVGTFLVRSGVLTSVHAFAQDPSRGVFVLGLLVIASGGALTLYATRAPSLRFSAPFAPVSREGALTLNNMLLITATGTVFLGTFYPLIVDALGDDKISVGPPYYNMTFVPIMIPLAIVMAIGPMLKWKRDNVRTVLPKLKLAGAVSVIVVFGIALAEFGRNVAAALGLGLAAWVVAGALCVIGYRIRLGRAPLSTILQLTRSTPRSIYGLVIAHAGIGLAIAGVTGMSAWKEERIATMKAADQAVIAGYDVTLRQVSRPPGPNYETERATFDVSYQGDLVTTLVSERRFYPVRQMQTTEAGIRSNFISNVYVALGEQNKAGEWTVRLYYHPLVPWIWLGGLMMAAGGLVSLSDRRFRVGAPQRAKLRAALAPAE